MWTLIPEEKYKRYFKYRPKSNIYCDCGYLNYDCEGIPYAYDEENNDVFFAHQCEKCGTIMYTKEQIMWKALVDILRKKACFHDWKLVKEVKVSCIRYQFIYICQKCGEIKQIDVK